MISLTPMQCRRLIDAEFYRLLLATTTTIDYEQSWESTIKPLLAEWRRYVDDGLEPSAVGEKST